MATIFALALIPVLFVVGMGIDYGVATDRKARLNACADAAVLAAVSPALLGQSDSAAAQTARSTFTAQAQSVQGASYDSDNVSVTVGTVNNLRTVSLRYTARSQNTFPNILGMNAITIAGSSTASAGRPPDIDFYLLLDASPSMAIAATTGGIATLVAATPAQGGCAFGCHQNNPAADGLGNPGGIDNYQLARNLGVTLRIDVLRQATQNMIASAATEEATYGTNYRMAIFTFDTQLNTITPLNASLNSAQSAAANIQMLTVDHNNWLTAATYNNDTDTNYDAAMNGANAAMPDPGNGTRNPGDKPQVVLFFVTDGVEDELSGGARRQSVMDPGWCATIKNRGIRIAVLYTSYLPLPTNAWYNTYIAPFQTTIGPTLQQCASPGLYSEVTPGGDISTAMTALFEATLQSAYLAH